MAFELNLADMLRLRFYCSQNNQVGINISYWTVISIVPQVFSNDIADAQTAILQPFYQPILSTSGTIWGLTVQRVLPGPETVATPTTLLPVTGTAASGPLPSQVSGIIGLKTDLAGRRFRGRQYIPFPSRTFEDAAGNATAGLVAALGNLVTYYATQQTIVATLGTCVLQCTITDKLFTRRTLVTSAQARQKFATQRRRGQFGAANAIPPF